MSELPYIGRTRPATVGWTRVVVMLALGFLLVAALAIGGTTLGPVFTVVVLLLFIMVAVWTWMRLWTTFVVDRDGLRIRYGGFLPRPLWPVEEFRTVQLRTVPAASMGVTTGGVGTAQGMVLGASPEQIRPVGDRKVFTTGNTKDRYQMQISRPGTLVEIIGTGPHHYLISPEDPEATAAAIDEAIRSRRSR
ncbi:MAG: hypothetical protein Q4G40_09030 [Brachybacterium sp.]|nr:hypothetical protein [Brachybacterium sp.]